jgi:large-conductance mechanosensitive channel
MEFLKEFKELGLTQDRIDLAIAIMGESVFGNSHSESNLVNFKHDHNI